MCALLALAACGSDEPDGPRPTLFGGDRPAELEAPTTLTPGKQYPLVVVLHGFGTNGFAQAAYLGLSSLASTDQALMIAPDGTPNSQGRQFWNADPVCCDFENQGPDDVAYIGGLIDDIVESWPVDKNAIYLVGHSNGGFMSYRMACERSDVIAAIAPLAGLASSTATSCNPARPVNVLHMHGTADATVPYTAGGSGIGTVGAEGSVTQWSGKNGCGAARTDGATIDIDNAVPGAETQSSKVNDCPANGEIELWRMDGSGHIPVFGPAFAPALMQWFTEHRRS